MKTKSTFRNHANNFLTHTNFSKGITLIALVITIIVLLILAAVSIATLTGDNGILTQAQRAENKTNQANAEEQVKVAVMGSYNNTGHLDYGELEKNLNAIPGISGVPASITDESFKGETPKFTVQVDGYNVDVYRNGDVKVGEKTPSTEKSSLEKAKDEGTIFNAKTTVEDKYGNKVVVPEKFKIAEDSAYDVTGGVVIEDASEEPTKGSQFVWIPVGEVKTESETKTITLNRYTFKEDGKETEKNQDDIEESEYYYKELKTSEDGNKTAKPEVYEAFEPKENGEKNKVEQTGGYYIGRYEARIEGYIGEVKTTNDNSESNWTGYTEGKLVEKGEEQVFNYITQNKASELCKAMYSSSSTFTSDLMNSYAYDTAIVFIQTFSDDKDYSRQKSLNTDSLANKGTQDKICNIYDMSSNCHEWTTETFSNSDVPCVKRGGCYYYSTTDYTSRRGNDTVSWCRRI